MNIKIDADSKNSWTSDEDGNLVSPPHLSSVLTIFSNREDRVEEDETKFRKRNIWIRLLSCCSGSLPKGGHLTKPVDEDFYLKQLVDGIDFETKVSLSNDNEVLLETDDFVITVSVKELRIPGLHRPYFPLAQWVTKKI
jgi:hypothetical protein